MLTFLVYLWLKLDTVLNGIWAVAVLYAIWLAFYGAFCALDADYSRKGQERFEVYKKNFRKRLIICLSTIFIVSIIPNSNQMAVLAATHYTQELVQSEEGQKIVQLIRKKATTYLDEQLKELDAAKVVDKVASQVQN